MNKIYLIFYLLFAQFLFAQDSTEEIKKYLVEHRQDFDLNSTDVSNWMIESKTTSKSTKATSYYIKQLVNEIEIFQSSSTIIVQNEKVIDFKSRFVKDATEKCNAVTPTLSPLQALQSAKRQLIMNSAFLHQITKQISPKHFEISNEPNTLKIQAKLVYHIMPNKNLQLAWNIMLDTPSQDHLWSIRVDALDGTILEKNDLVISCQFDHHSLAEEYQTEHFFGFHKMQNMLLSESSAYRVLPFTTESPNHGGFELLLSPYDPIASPFGWHDVDGVLGADFTITRGNNVHAFEDLQNINEGESPDGGPNLVFDYPYLGSNVPAINYLDAATTNLFYMNNILHDVFYRYGFDEESGNFQQNNYGLQGDGDDFVRAQAQDGGGLNNANFATPSDGNNGRMQMYLWNRKPGSNALTITSPLTLVGSYLAFESAFNTGNILFPTQPQALESQLVLVQDEAEDVIDGCDQLINSEALVGAIALIQRGNCTLITKILNAQNAGAIAVVLANNVEGNFVASGFGNEEITIPVLTVKKDVGDFLIEQVSNRILTVSISVPATDFVNIDGDFDNLIIAHEYGHGISNRLTGGRLNSDCLSNDEQMGEGWSDWFGLMLQLKPNDVGEARRGIGTFAINTATDDVGIRSYPYSTDMTINPLTFNDTNTLPRPHGVGSVWATMLWDLTWSYIEKYGFDTDIYDGTGGNNKVLQIVVDALKLQPCFPSFEDGRNAILQADELTTGGQDYCLIWEVFARRGLGFLAQSNDTFSKTDQVEDFSVPPPNAACSLSVNENDIINKIVIFPIPSEQTITVVIPNYGGKASFDIIDTNGRLIKKLQGIDFQNQEVIDINLLQTGIYFVKISTETFSTTKKIIKSN